MKDEEDVYGEEARGEDDADDDDDDEGQEADVEATLRANVSVVSCSASLFTRG